MQSPTCAECGAELETTEVREPVGDEITLRRKRSYCPECESPENATVDRSSGGYSVD